MSIVSSIRSHLHAAEQAAKIVGTSRSSVVQAKKVKREVPALLDTVREGDLSIEDAAAVAKLPIDVRAGVVDEIKSKPTREAKHNTVKAAVSQARQKPDKTMLSIWSEIEDKDRGVRIFRLLLCRCVTYFFFQLVARLRLTVVPFIFPKLRHAPARV